MNAELVDLLWSHRWWAWFDAERPHFSYLYRGINLGEAVAWLVVAAFILRRWRMHATEPTHRGLLEPVYALAFVAFGVSDLREAVALQGWLVAVKLAILIALVFLRRATLRRYPGARAF